MCALVVLLFSSILTHDGAVFGLERDRVFLYDDSTHVLSFDQLRKVSVCCNHMLVTSKPLQLCRFYQKCYTVFILRTEVKNVKLLFEIDYFFVNRIAANSQKCKTF